jgi:hypothetical protein
MSDDQTSRKRGIKVIEVTAVRAIQREISPLLEGHFVGTLSVIQEK